MMHTSFEHGRLSHLFRARNAFFALDLSESLNEHPPHDRVHDAHFTVFRVFAGDFEHFFARSLHIHQNQSVLALCIQVFGLMVNVLACCRCPTVERDWGHIVSRPLGKLAVPT